MQTRLMFGLIQPRTRLDYLPPRASLITSSADYPKEDQSDLTYSKAMKCLLKQLCIQWLLKSQTQK